MAINFGIALGSALKSGVDTYAALSEEEERALNIRERRERMAREKQFRDITAEELGRVGQLPQTSTDALREATGVMPAEQTSSAIPMDASAAPSLRQAAGVRERRSSVGAQASAMPASTSSVTREDALLRIMERGMAVDPDRAFDMALKGMQLEDVLATNKSKKEFRQWQSGFNNELTNLKNLADMAETNPQEFLTGAKKIGIDIRPVSTGGGKQIFEAYMNDQKMGQYDSLSAAANDGLERYSTNMLIQGAAKFATTPEQFVTILSTSERINMDRRRLGLDESKEAREAKMQPGKIALNSAQIANLNVETEGKTLAAKEKKEYNELKTKILDLLKNPSPENQQELSQLARRAGILNPKEVLVTKTERNPDTGILESITVNVFTGEVQKSMTEGGVPNARDWAAAQQGKRPDGTTLKPEDITRWNAAHGPEYQISTGGPARPSAIPTQPSAAPDAAPARTGPARTGRGAAIPAGDRIPDPPPKELIRGTNRRPNPAYAEWEQKFGERYRAQQR